MSVNNKITTLLFDLGGVIMNIKRQNCVEAFRRLGMADPDAYLGEYSQKGPFEGVESGRLTVAEFHDAIRQIIGNPEITDAQIDHAFGEFLLGIPMHRLKELRELAKRYRICMLSNTNPIMWADGIDRAFRAEGGSVTDYFDGIVRSFDARSMKPDAGIFQFAIEKLGLNPEQTLFLDDSQRNLDAAAQLGFHTLLVPPGTEFMQLLTEAGY